MGPAILTTIGSKRATGGPSKFAIGNLNTRNGNFRIFFILKEQEGAYFIQLIRRAVNLLKAMSLRAFLPMRFLKFNRFFHASLNL
ncbi:MAG: DUF4783 domain-containing protein [Sphingobacteriia bacterium]|nr:DUF4783 domain-containing protein [Sphingobacteriia bacterium]